MTNEDYYDTSSEGVYDRQIVAQDNLAGGRLLLADVTRFVVQMHQ